MTQLSRKRSTTSSFHHVVEDERKKSSPSSSRRSSALKSRSTSILCTFFLQMILFTIGIIFIFASRSSEIINSQHDRRAELAYYHDQKQKMGVENPHTSTRSAIVYFADLTSEKEVNQLKLSLYYLNKNFLFRFPHTVKIFYFTDADKTQAYMKDLLSVARVEFHRIHFDKIPENDKVEPLTCKGKEITIHDRVKTHFMISQIYQKHLKHYDFYWRLKPTTYLATPIWYDIFDIMLEDDYIYAYIETKQYQESCFDFKVLYDAVSTYLGSLNKILIRIKEKDLEDLNRNKLMFSESFEIGKVDFFLSKDYLGYVKTIENSKGIINHGWSEMAIKTIAVTALIPYYKFLRIQDICFYEAPNWFFYREAVQLPLMWGFGYFLFIFLLILLFFRSNYWSVLSVHFGFWNSKQYLIGIPCLAIFIIGMISFNAWVESVLYVSLFVS